MRESKAFFEHTISNSPTPDSRNFEALLGWSHELIHFIQSISTNYLYNYSLSTLKYAFNVLDNFQEFLSIKKRTTFFEDAVKALSVRDNGLSVRDLLEGVATFESFNMTLREPTEIEFLEFREKFTLGNGDNCYWNSFDYLSDHGDLDESFSYNLLSPLSFMALQSDNPPRSFKAIVDDILPTLSLDEVVDANVPELFSLFGMDIRNHLLSNLNSMPIEMQNPILYSSAKYAVNALGLPRLLEIAARPSIIKSIVGQETIEALYPPLVAFSSTPGSKLWGMTFGVCKQDRKLAELMMRTTGLIGAAERLTLLKDGPRPYQFCPHTSDCPHSPSALCFNYFAPPSIELGYKNCRFIRFFESRTGMKPDRAWEALTSK